MASQCILACSHHVANPRLVASDVTSVLRRDARLLVQTALAGIVLATAAQAQAPSAIIHLDGDPNNAAQYAAMIGDSEADGGCALRERADGAIFRDHAFITYSRRETAVTVRVYGLVNAQTIVANFGSRTSPAWMPQLEGDDVFGMDERTRRARLAHRPPPEIATLQVSLTDPGVAAVFDAGGEVGDAYIYFRLLRPRPGFAARGGRVAEIQPLAAAFAGMASAIAFLTDDASTRSLVRQDAATLH